MAFQWLSFETAGGEADALGDALLAAGALSVEIADALGGTPLEQAWFDEPGASRSWTRARIGVLLEEHADADAILRQACRLAAILLPQPCTRERLDDRDWVRATRRQFKPLEVAPGLWVVPTWERPPQPDAINLVLDPGAAFGTGSHPTTRLCLRWLRAVIGGGERVLDYGCGSGILAIAALRLGAGLARGVDIDAQALVVARDNAMQNGVAAEFAAPGGETAFGADVVVANILANPLIALAPLLAQATRPGGRIALSGILRTQCDEVAAAYQGGFELEAPAYEDDWALLAGRRREPPA